MKAFYTTTDYPVPWIDVKMPYGPAESLGVQQWNSEDIPGQSHTLSDDLTKIIGKKLTAYIASVKDTRAIDRWIAGSESYKGVEERLRFAYRVAKMIRSEDDQ